MNGVLFICKSVTHAQRMEKTLKSKRIPAEIVRPDIEITRKNCAYAVRIPESFLPEAAEIFRENRITPAKVVLAEKDGTFREIYI